MNVRRPLEPDDEQVAEMEPPAASSARSIRGGPSSPTPNPTRCSPIRSTRPVWRRTPRTKPANEQPERGAGRGALTHAASGVAVPGFAGERLRLAYAHWGRTVSDHEAARIMLNMLALLDAAPVLNAKLLSTRQGG